jgi:SAM-dependent methyltransferase
VSEPDDAARRAAVRERYGGIAESEGSCCGDDASGGTDAAALGYDADDLAGAAAEADLGLSCGNPTALAALSPGETVLDLGSGGGFDCFVAAREVGPGGRVVGVDMTPEMVERARATAADRDEDGVAPVEFRLGEIEHLPVADDAVDVVLSNCVVNLSPDKPQVFREAMRVLRPGGRLAVSDVVLTGDLPAGLRDDLDALSACVAGAAPVDRLEAMLADAGFADVRVEPRADGAEIVDGWDEDHDLGDALASARITARAPDS